MPAWATHALPGRNCHLYYSSKSSSWIRSLCHTYSQKKIFLGIMPSATVSDIVNSLFRKLCMPRALISVPELSNLIRYTLWSVYRKLDFVLLLFIFIISYSFFVNCFARRWPKAYGHSTNLEIFSKSIFFYSDSYLVQELH